MDEDVVYSREVFIAYSKSRLLDHIENQADQVVRLQTRFRDVVGAYKSLLKEKEALEATLKALGANASRSRGCSPQAKGVGLQVQQQQQIEGVAGDGESDRSVGPSPVDQENAENLQHKLSTLMQSMTTLSEEKAKIEAGFQADRKIMLANQETLTKQLHTTREEGEKERSSLKKQLENVQLSLQQEQRERREEELHHKEMLMELQTLLAREREAKEDMALKLQDVEVSLDTHKSAGHKAKEYEQNIATLSQELQRVTEQLNIAEEQASHPPPLLATLQQEIAQIKEEHQLSLSREQSKVAEAEERLQQQALHEEQLVTSLENKLSGLSKTVGDYERQHDQDKTTIHKLKERISQLDQENTSLTKAHVERQEALSAERHQQLNDLQEKITRLKKYLRISTAKLIDKTSIPSNLEDLTTAEYTSLLSDIPSLKECLQQLTDLKREFDNYRTRAHSVLKNRDNKELMVGTNQEMKELLEENAELKQQLAEQLAHHEHEMEQSLAKAQQLREDMRTQHEEYQKKLMQAENGYKHKLQELQSRIQSTRERTSTLLQDKDAEISRLKSELVSSSRMNFRLTSQSPNNLAPALSDDNRSGDTSALSDDEPSGSYSHPRLLPTRASKKNEAMSAVKAILNKPVADEEIKLLHFIQEQARRDAEIAMARRKCIELEENIRDYHDREEKLIEQSTVLKEEIRRLERSRSRETANLEYLKNIILHYMSSDKTGKDHMINAIATVLHFSPHEILLIKQNQSGWWGST